MEKTFFFENINILMGPNTKAYKDSLLIIDGKIEAFGDEAKKRALKKNIESSKSGNKLVAPLLVDIHSFLKDPLTGSNDNLEILKSRAKKSGFGAIAFLPNSDNWRDKPEKIPFQNNNSFDLNIYFWGSFSLGDEGINLSPHDELLKSGSIGLCTRNFFDSPIIFKGLSLDTVNSSPIIFSLTKKNSVQKGIVNKDLKSLQSGFYVIDNNNELSEVKNILELKNLFQSKNIIIKNISDSNSLKEIEKQKIPISTTISWWSLIADTNNLELDDLGWKVDPPLGSQENREFLIKGLEKDLIQAIAVNSIGFNDENTFIPINDRSVGISSFELVLPLLWKEFIIKRDWPISKLWNYLSFNSSNLLNINQEKLSLGSKRWLIFDPDTKWVNSQKNLGYDSPSNFPKKNELIKGKVIEVGLDF
ncbi:putative dihydroorotase [Prochlorococcus marinus str. MIT 9515]|uniref:Putative dihydroorotase n=1 Tax=Prochlorococcus marinus (strain MIT 9515) TaxID=167542 RepID=A2BVH6_PROM5|nr:dihydroorotase [Prochlorococcus marinus]ABM71787.1 putative dihydroorotase [Prochlorococcus marinus str. MIT 9515]